jgi:hypothetical protein
MHKEDRGNLRIRCLSSFSNESNQILTLVKDLEWGHYGNSGPTVGSRLALDPDSQTSPGSLVLTLHTKMPQG